MTPGALVALAAIAVAQAPVPFDERWELGGEGTRIESYRGTRALRLRNGQAIRRDVRFEDGTIEFDVELTPHRSFVYLTFRMTSDDEYEELYFRPHKSSLPDAVQYSPVWRGVSNWQLYHGPGGTARIPLPHRRWMHVRLVVEGKRAALFTGRGTEPDMIIPLGRDPAAGYLGLAAFTPQGGAPEGEPVAAFANLVVRPGHLPYRIPAPPADSAPPGLVTRWQLSPPFPAGDTAAPALPDSVLPNRARWPAVPVEPTGMLVVDRHLVRSAPVSGTVARLVLRADRPVLQRLHLGYSDYLTVYFGGRPVFAGDAHYSFDRPRQEGLIGLWQATIWLPLIAGDNEVLLALADGFGGWGLTARVDPADGAAVVPPGP